jgi:hypothetical protein
MLLLCCTYTFLRSKTTPAIHDDLYSTWVLPEVAIYTRTREEWGGHFIFFAEAQKAPTPF